MRQALLLLAVVGSTAVAQAPGPDARVRLLSSEKSGPTRVGKLVSTNGDSAVIRFEPVPDWDIRAETRQVSRYSLETVVATRRFTKVGAGIGAVAGIVAGAIVARPYRPYCEPMGSLGPPNCGSDDTPTIVLGLAGGVAGAGLGALGGRLVKREKWAPLVQAGNRQDVAGR